MADYTGCKTKQEYINDGFQVIESSDGTISIFDQINQTPSIAHENKICCEALGYSFDIESQKCKWAEKSAELFKVILNPQGNSSAFFEVEENETCCVDVSFDYLFSFDCETMQTLMNATTAGGTAGGGTAGGGTAGGGTTGGASTTSTSVFPQGTTYSTALQTYNFGIPYNQRIISETNPFDFYVGFYKITSLGVDVGVDGNFFYESNYDEFTDALNDGWIIPFPIISKVQSNNQFAIFGTEAWVGVAATLPPQLPATFPSVSSCESYLDIFENFNVVFTLEKLNETTGLLETVYEESLMNIGFGNLYDYIDATSGNTGIRIGSPTGLMPTIEEDQDQGGAFCFDVRDSLVEELRAEYLLSNPAPTTDAGMLELDKKLTGWYQSCWLQYESKICDPYVLSVIENEKINLSISIKDCCTDFSILLDRIKVIKNCEKVDNVVKHISEPPKFNLRKVCDNKKSWIANESPDSRDFELKYRNTEYNTNHHRLVINTKEVELNLSPARAVEQDVWCYINDNNCILEGCGDSNSSYTAFTCPSGFSAETDGDTCSKYTITAAINNTGTAEFEVGPGYRLERQHHKVRLGTIFTEEDVSNKPWPLGWQSKFVLDEWEGPYLNTSKITDADDNYILHTAFGNGRGVTMYPTYQGGYHFDSPEAFCGIQSWYGDASGKYNFGLLNANIIWGGANNDPNSSDGYELNDLGGGISLNGAYCPGGTPCAEPPQVPGAAVGPLMRSGVWARPFGTELANGQWIGFSKCLDLPETKIYYLGFTGDDNFRIRVNGEWLWNDALRAQMGVSDDRPTNGPPSSSVYNRGGGRHTFQVLPITLPAGKNIIEMEGINVGGYAVGLVVELYDTTLDVLKNIRYESELEDVTIFSTKNEVGNKFPLGENSGYSCPAGYSLDTCVPPPYQCVEIEKTSRYIEQKDIIGCCCEGTPIFVKNYENTTITLPLTYSTGSTLDCNDIQALVNDYGGSTTLESLEVLKCGSVTALGTGTTSEFNGFWFAQENDGTIGVYEASWTSGSTGTYENVSNQVTSGCCSIIDGAFETYANTFEQGIDSYKSISWDPNKKRCAYAQCGDDGCLNIDDMLTTELSEIDTVKEFDLTLSSELIDVKNRQTISGYPTMRMLYDRYNNNALDYCDIQSSRFDYFDMDDFGQTMGNYWIDLIEQVVPATTIWGSTYTYKNTIFDTQKYSYKNNNTYLCDDPSKDFPWSAISKDSSASVIIETVHSSGSTASSDIRNCMDVWTMQNTCGSEFLGRVTTSEDAIAPPVPCTLSNITFDVVQTDIGVYSATAEYGLPVVGPITFLWNYGQTIQTVTGLIPNDYNVILTDVGADSCTAYAELTISDAEACWYRLPEDTQYVLNCTIPPLLTGATVYTQVFSMANFTRNGEVIDVGYTETMSASTGSTNINWISSNNNTVSGTTTGLTYTNYVSFLNNAFQEAGLYPDYHAQISTAFTITRTFENSGFYIVRPAGDSFTFTVDNFGAGSFDQFYSDSCYGTEIDNGNIVINYGYDAYTCENITVTNGVVIE